jgi:hypothetical protein
VATLDPCGFYTAASFAAKSQTSQSTNQLEVQIAPSDFNTCGIAVGMANNAGIVDVNSLVSGHVDLSKLDPSKYTITPQGQVKVITPANQADQQCEKYIATSDQTLIDITAKPRNSSASGADFCGLATIAVNDAVTSVNQGAKHLAAYPANSAGSLKTCSLVDAASVSAVLNQTGIAAQPAPGNHACDYSVPNNTQLGSYAFLNTLLNTQPIKAAPEYGITESTLAGRPTFITANPSSGSAYCEVQTPVQTWSPWPATIAEYQATSSSPPATNQVIEYETFAVQANGTPDQVCGMAQQIATKIWPKLPPAS